MPSGFSGFKRPKPGSDATGVAPATQVFDIRAFGAKANGTDYSTEVQNALTAAMAVGGMMWVPQGTYVAAGLTASSACMIAGPGTLKRPAGGTQSVLKITGANVTVQDITIDGNRANNASGGNDPKNSITLATNVTPPIDLFARILNVRIINSRDNAIEGHANHVLVKGCLIEDTVENGVLIRGSFNRIEGNTVDTTDSQNAIFVTASVAAAPTVENVYGNVITDNAIINPGDFGVEVGIHAHHTSVLGNTIRYTTATANPPVGIGVRDAQYVTVLGNTVLISTARTDCVGIEFLAFHETESTFDWYGVVSGNTVKCNAGKGVYARGRHISVIGNQVIGGGAGGEYHGIYLERDFHAVSGNDIQNWKYGISLDPEGATATMQQVTIVGNVVETVTRGVYGFNKALTGVLIADNVVKSATETGYIFSGCTGTSCGFANNRAVSSGVAQFSDMEVFGGTILSGVLANSVKLCDTNFANNDAIVNRDADGSIVITGAAGAGNVKVGLAATAAPRMSGRKAAADANAAWIIGFEGTGTNPGLKLGAGAGSAVDVVLDRPAANQLRLAAGDSLLVDTIAETTGDGGVRVDTLLLKDRIVGAAGENLGFYGIGPVARPAAITQTYATTSGTHAALTAAVLTDSTGQTPDTTIANVPAATASGVDTGAASLTSTNAALTAIEGSLSDLADQHNKANADVANVKQVLNQVIDYLQSQGLLQ